MASSKRRRQPAEENERRKQARIADEPENTLDSIVSLSNQGLPAVTDVLEELKTLLDLSALNEPEQISTRFDAIAEVLLNRISLRISVPNSDHSDCAGQDKSTAHIVTDYAILEVEFYLYKAGCHEDPFTHGTEEQRISGRW